MNQDAEFAKEFAKKLEQMEIPFVLKGNIIHGDWNSIVIYSEMENGARKIEFQSQQKTFDDELEAIHHLQKFDYRFQFGNQIKIDFLVDMCNIDNPKATMEWKGWGAIPKEHHLSVDGCDYSVKIQLDLARSYVRGLIPLGLILDWLQDQGFSGGELLARKMSQ